MSQMKKILVIVVAVSLAITTLVILKVENDKEARLLRSLESQEEQTQAALKRYRESTFVTTPNLVENKKSKLEIKVKTMRVSKIDSGWCNVGIDITAVKSINNFGLKLFPVDNNNNVVDNAVVGMFSLTKGVTRYEEFKLFNVACGDIKDFIWEVM